MNEIITVTNLRKSYGDKEALKNLSLSVCSGEVFGLLGHNGAGKTTAIECILGVKESDGGNVSVLGMNPDKDRKKLFENVGVQFQQSGYPEKIKVHEICEVRSSLYKSTLDYKKLLSDFGLSGFENSFVAELSGGERQKLSVLLALIPNPKVLFLDELTTGLDTKARHDVWDHLKKLKESGTTILLTSHFMDEVEALCDRICILKQGEVYVEGTVKEVIAMTPYDRLEEAYLWLTENDSIENENENEEE